MLEPCSFLKQIKSKRTIKSLITLPFFFFLLEFIYTKNKNKNKSIPKMSVIATELMLPEINPVLTNFFPMCPFDLMSTPLVEAINFIYCAV